MPGVPDKRAKAKTISESKNFKVLEPVNKRELFEQLQSYDAGLLWAPVRKASISSPKVVFDYNFLSAASNKICEYHAAGLVAVHTGNPGLSYLPKNVAFEVDPWHPEDSAIKLAEYLRLRRQVEERRNAAFTYYQNEMNAEYQAMTFLQFIDSLDRENK